MLVNMLSNAFKFTVAGSISVAMQRAGPERDQLYVEIKDTGPGISPELKPRLFQKFVQVRGNNTARL